jgi:ferrous iron transport protein B
VEKKEGSFVHNDVKVNIVDLPGIYSLSAHSEDERVAMDYIRSGEADIILNIADSINLERNLYLTTQIIEMKVTMLLVLNRADLAEKEKLSIDAPHLSESLGLQVLSCSAIRKNDIPAVKEAILALASNPAVPSAVVEYPNEIEDVLSKWTASLRDIASETGVDARWLAIKLMEGDNWAAELIMASKALTEKDIKASTAKIEGLLHETADILVADHRYGFISGLAREVLIKKADRKRLSNIIDRFVLNRILGIPIFLLIMYLLFWVTISIGGAFIDFFDIAFGAVFVDGFGHLLGLMGSPEWLTAILAGGIGSGIQTVATFIPVIFAMFFMLSLLEDSGYMARAAFVMDRFMRIIGLPGKSFVPMLVGFGCTVPAIMATRTLESKRDRMLTIFMAPFMSCGARLPVYALFAAAFFPESSGLMVFAIYMTGIGLAILTGLLMKKTLLRGEASHFIMELPVYNPPRLRHIMIHTWNRLKQFVLRASRIIVIMVTVLAFLNSLGTDGSFGNEDKEKSVLSKIGKAITPIFTPMGVEKDNWPASVALFTGLFAKEAVVGTLNSLYSQSDMSSSQDKSADEKITGGNTAETAAEAPSEDEEFSLSAKLKEALATIPENLSGVFGALSDPLGTGIISEAGDQEKVAGEIEVDRGIFESMRRHFAGGQMQVFAYLIFILVYFPCVAAMGAIVRETGLGMALFQSAYLTILAWVAATLFYQIALGHSMLWISIAAGILIFMVFSMIIASRRKNTGSEAK